MPIGPECSLLARAARADPTALDEVILVLVNDLNAGFLHAGSESGPIRLLCDLAEVSEYLRARVASAISQVVLEFYCSDYASPNERQIAQRLSETLKVERPKHYFDLCRSILASNGSIFIIGAGFSYDSYAPLLREMEGIACCTLFDLQVTNPREVYRTSEREAWELISGGWQIFQNHVAFTLLPKEPSEQHLILAELFHVGYVVHIVSLNWDDLLEKAYRKLYNEDIPSVTAEGKTSTHALWKLHGDIANPGERWVLPFEEGRVFSALQQIALQVTIPTIVIGYREQERAMRGTLTAVLQKRGGVTRIRPDLPNDPPESFADNALMAMKKIKAGFETAKKLDHPN